jgi:site-specific DNA recombinase
MARTKNRGTNIAVSLFSKQAPKWRLGKYLRLSKDDFKRGNAKDKDKEVSDSIENQRKILNEFEQMNVDEFEWSEEYKDDGFTGTDADRDDFQRLLSDIRTGKINCVIIKDLSRLSRDYVEAGILIDRLFVQMNVRFISLHERIDSYNDPESVSSMVVPITNVMNDQYCY